MRPCKTCNGNGELLVNGYVYPGEPHQAPVDVETCPECHGTGEVEEDHEEKYS